MLAMGYLVLANFAEWKSCSVIFLPEIFAMPKIRLLKDKKLLPIIHSFNNIV